MIEAVAIALVGVILILLRRPLSRVLLAWRQLFPPRLRGKPERAGEVLLVLLGGFALFLGALVVMFG